METRYHGFLLSDYQVREILSAEKENAICAKCEGLPCKKNQNPNYQSVIQVSGQQILLATKKCKYAQSAFRQREVDEKLRLAKIPARYKGKTFEDYQVDNDNADAVAKAKKYLKNPQNGLLFYGKPGRGKSLLAAIISQEMLKKGKSVIFRDVPSLLENLQQSYDNKNNGTINEKMEALTKVDLLVLDDVGTEKPTEWAITRLYLIINERYNANKPMIVTSNYSGVELAKRLNNPVGAKSEGVTGNRIVSRLSEMCEVATLGGRDRRIGK